jgi:hypothetical protein
MQLLGQISVQFDTVAMKAPKRPLKPNPLSRAAGKALRRAGKQARAIAKAHGTPLYIWRDGKIVAEKP